MRAILRMLGFAMVLIWYLSGLLLSSWIFGETEERGFKYRRAFTKGVMRVLGVRLTVKGRPASHAALYAGNHRSLLDPMIQLHYIDAYVVAKAEISKYPLVGKGATETGVVFVKRENTQSRQSTRDTIKNLLQSGKSVLIYPEGTTSNVPTTQEFKPGSFEIAAELGVPVVPVMIDYADHNHYWQDIPMLPFFMRKFASKRIIARLSIGEPVFSRDPVELMTKTREWIGREIINSCLPAGRDDC
jgi:1-acyl-sn-glycerol-3-phosphate acyltransferase